MSQRVVYRHRHPNVPRTGAQEDVLFSSSDGDVVAVADAALMLAEDDTPRPELLYFSRAAYDAAVSGLDGKQVAEVLSKRRREWAPQACDQMLNWIYQRERQSLTLAAVTTASAYFRECVIWTSRVVNEGRYDDVDTTELLVLAAERQALLRVELQSPEHHRQDPHATWEIELHTWALEQLGAALADRGRPEYAQGFPYAETSRVVHVFPLDPQVLGLLKQQSEPSFAWHEGLVVGRRERQIEQLRQDGKPAPVIFWDSGWFLEALVELTPTQLSRECERQVQQTPEQGERRRSEYLNGLRLETLLLSHALYEHAAREAPPLVGFSGRLIEAEAVALSGVLARDRSWLDERPGDAAVDLAGSENELCRDLSLFAELARLRGDASLADRFSALLAHKAGQIGTLSNAAFGAPP